MQQRRRFVDIEERRLKEWENYQRSQRSTIDQTNPKVFLDFSISDTLAGRVVIELFEDVAPLTVRNFRSLVTGDRLYDATTGIKLDYVDSPVHRIVKGGALWMGELNCLSLPAAGAPLKDENFAVRHTQRGLLSMVNCGPNTSGSAFCITLDKVPSYDFIQVVFARIVDGLSVLDKLEAVPTTRTGLPRVPVTISFCGALTGKRPTGIIVSPEESLKEAPESLDATASAPPAAGPTDEQENKDVSGTAEAAPVAADSVEAASVVPLPEENKTSQAGSEERPSVEPAPQSDESSPLVRDTTGHPAQQDPASQECSTTQEQPAKQANEEHSVEQ